MKTRNYWPLFFIGIFTFTLGMIFWTISSAIKTPVHEDESFLISYHNLDRDFNKIVESNHDFLKEYDFVLSINSQKLKLDIQDVYYSQRVLDKKSLHKDLYKVGDNKILFFVKNKKTQETQSIKIKFNISRATNSYSDLNYDNASLEQKNNTYSTIVKIDKAGNLNITGFVETKTGKKGYFFIKSNAI
ncbi:MAG: hypothetical protein HRT41_05965 [Campylobacteraceae bacterium]|nr:hypothetical protein [Campylobacteraceae bacterium]